MTFAGTTWRGGWATLAAAVTTAVASSCALGSSGGAGDYVPPLWTAGPFAILLLLIAVLPLVKRCEHVWHNNRNKLLVALALSVPVVLFYGLGHPATTAVHNSHATPLAAGWPVLGNMLRDSLIEEYFPFLVLLLSLYTISGGIAVREDLPAHPRTNTILLAIGAVTASFIGTTGAAMLLIRPLLQINAERKHVRHSVIFFIFIVCNTGGCLLPIGDPPLFLGYLMGVPFFWTLKLLPEWLVVNGLLLAIYYIWDRRAYAKESPQDIRRDEAVRVPLHILGKINFLYLALTVLAVATLIPGRPFAVAPGWFVSHTYLREIVLLALAGLSLLTTPRGLRKANHFNFHAIGEVAALFIGIFLTMQPPIEMLRNGGASLGLTEPWQYYWATGSLSSFLDNAPTYVVFFETANSLTHAPGEGILRLANGQYIRADLLAAVSLGAVFMGAMTYIGNGPNFMVKAIAEHRGIRMPGFFGYMAYSVCILVPLLVVVDVIFFVMRWLL